MNEKLEAMVEKLQQERDELKLKMHLAKADAREEFDKLDDRWKGAKAKFDAASGEASEITEPVMDAARDLLEEIRQGYRKIRERL
jgi:hypothetical protein